MAATTFAGCSAYATVACLIVSVTLTESNAEMSNLVGLDFEVFGKVQGVFFRKYTQKRSEELGLTGWCKNTKGGTVVGRVEGEQSKINNMKKWLQTTGSPQSTIERAEFHNEEEISELSFTNFSIKK